MAMITCKRCGLEHSDQLLRCPFCGAPTPLARRQDRVYGAVEKQRRWWRRALYTAIALALALVVWWAWSSASGMLPSSLGSMQTAPIPPAEP